MDAERLPSRSVSVKPGRTLLIVMHGASSFDMDFAHEAIAPRRVLDSPMLGMGSFTEVEMIWMMIRPNPSASMPGTAAFTSVWAACRCRRKGASKSETSLSSKGPPGATGVVDENVNGPQGLGCRRKGRGKHVGVLQVEHQRLVASAAQVPQCFAQRRGERRRFGRNVQMSAPAFASILAVASPMPLLAPHTKACFP